MLGEAVEPRQRVGRWCAAAGEGTFDRLPEGAGTRGCAGTVVGVEVEREAAHSRRLPFPFLVLSLGGYGSITTVQL